MTLTPLFSAACRFGVALGLLGVATVASAGEVRFAGEGHAQSPQFAPDGSHLSFEVNRFGQGGNNNIDLMIAKLNGDIAPGEAMLVKMPGTSGGGFGGAAAQTAGSAQWHPTDGVVIFQASDPNGKFRLYFAQPGVTPSQMLDKNKAAGDLTSPTLSPDGNVMVFTSDQTGEGDLYSWNRNTDVVKQVSSSPDNEMFSSFSGDGGKIVHIRKTDADSDILMTPAAGGASNTVMGGGGEQTRPVFAMGNSKIVYFSNERNDKQWDLMVGPAGGPKGQLLAENVVLPYNKPPTVTGPNNEWVVFSYVEKDSDKIQFKKVDGSASKTIPTGFKKAEDPAVLMKDGRWLLAFTALPAQEDGWRFAFVKDITNEM